MKRNLLGRSAVVGAAAAAVSVLNVGTPASAVVGSAQLVTQVSGRCLDVDAGTETNARTNVQLYNCRDPHIDPLVGYQQFDFPYIPGQPLAYFKIRNLRTGKCLTYTPNGGTSSPVWAESCDKNGQGWEFIPKSDAGTQFHAVQTLNPSLCLDDKDSNGGLPDRDRPLSLLRPALRDLVHGLIAPHHA